MLSVKLSPLLYGLRTEMKTPLRTIFKALSNKCPEMSKRKKMYGFF